MALGGSCRMYPLVDGKRSKLYSDLLNKTNNDRKLTNALYALSLLEKDSLKENEKNKQGEYDTKLFIEKFKVNELIADHAKLKEYSLLLDAIDDSGKPIIYNNPDEVKDRVIEFNNIHDDYVASIEYLGANKFIVTVEYKNADNLSKNNNLKTNDEKWRITLSSLQNAGLDIHFDEPSYFNFLNVYHVDNIINDFLQNKFKRLNRNNAAFMVETMKGTDNYNLLKNHFGDLFINALITYSYIGVNTTAYPQPLSTYVDFNDTMKGRLSSFINEFRTKIRRINRDSFNLQLEDVNERSKQSFLNEQYKGYSLASLRKTLSNLYDKFHIDLELSESRANKIKKLSDLAKEILRVLAINLNLARKKGQIKKHDQMAKLNAIRKKIDSGAYVESIAAYLENLNKEIEDKLLLIEELKDKVEAMSEGSESYSLSDVNKLSFLINELSYLISSNELILDRLSAKDFQNREMLLEDDDLVSDQSLKDALNDSVSSLREMFNDFNQNKDEIIANTIFTFLSLYWGKDSQLLKDLMDTKQIDIGVLNRWLDSIHDCTNPLIAVYGDAVASAHRRRDLRMNDIAAEVRRITNRFGSANTRFMMMFDDKGIPTGKLRSPYNWNAYYNDRKLYIKLLNEQKLKSYEFREKLALWENDHTLNIVLGSDLGLNLNTDIKIQVPDSRYVDRSFLNNLNLKLKDYYIDMMRLKGELTLLIPEFAQNFYDAILISSTNINAAQNAGMNPTKISKLIKTKIGDRFKHREDDTEYGMISTVNGVKQDLIDANGDVVYRLPLFFTHELKDKSRLSTDFSRNITAMAGAIINYDEMSKMFDVLTLAKTYLVNKEVTKNLGLDVLGSIVPTDKKNLLIQTARSKLSNTASFLEDYYESVVLGRYKKPEYWGNTSVDKIADSLTSYTSIVGLSTNILGALSNYLVGKILMLIESGLGFGGEFFGFKDLLKAQVLYGSMIMPAIAEMASNNRKSKLNLLMDFFDVSDDFFLKLLELGFNTNLMTKILGNSSLFMLYGGGEHILHAETMLAVLNHVKVLNPLGKKVSLYDALDVKVTDGNGTLVVKPGYTTLDGGIIDLKSEKGLIDKTRRQIKYCNNSMHGAFGADDKGMLHRYFVGRLIMNFRQWMPAHFKRRFGLRRYNSILQEDREGFYVSTARFMWLLAKDCGEAKFLWKTRWRELSDMERYNIARCGAESLLLWAIWAAISLAGDYKDHKNNWARRNLIYQLRRAELELGATSVIWLPPSTWLNPENESYKGKNPLSPVDNIQTLLLSPMSATKTFDGVRAIFSFSKIGEEYETGRLKGESKYWHGVKREVPLSGKLESLLFDFVEEDAMFLYMN